MPNQHYAPKRNAYLDPDTGLWTLNLTQGLVTILDEQDVEFAQQWNWHAAIKPSRFTYHAKTSVHTPVRRALYLHREIARRFLPLTEELEVDHINCCGWDNRRENLRLATRLENARNLGMRSYNTSGYKGVSFVRGRWRAQISVANQTILLGFYLTLEQASAAYAEASIRYHGEFGNLGVDQDP